MTELSLPPGNPDVIATDIDSPVHDEDFSSMDEAMVRAAAAGWSPDAVLIEHRSAGREIWGRLRRDRVAMTGLVAFVFLILIAIAAPWIAPHDPTVQFRDGLQDNGLPVGPSARFPLGTDNLGRDLLSRLLYGARVSLVVGISARFLTLIPAIVLGLLAGFLGGKTETVIMRFTDVMMAFPLFLLAMALMTVVEPSQATLIAVVAFVFWTPLARVLHTEVLTIREKEFVDAARLTGCSNLRIVFRHILPHLVAPIIVYTTLGIGSIILFEAAMSYVGLGIRPPTPSWGNMIAAGQRYYLAAPLLVVAPGVMIVVTVLAFNLLGDGLRDAFDPLQRRAR